MYNIDTMFELDFRNIIVLISLAIHASLLWVLYRYARKTHSGRAYSVAILAIVGWIFPMFLFRMHLFGETLLWARMLYIMASLTSTTFLFFTFIFPDNKRPAQWIQILLLLENLFIVFICLHPTWMIRGIKFVQGKEDIILWGPLYFVYSSHISLFFLAGFIILFKKWHRETGLAKKQIIYILGGYFLGANLAMTTNLILPWFGYFELNWLGQFFSTLVAAFTTFAILKHQLLNIRVIATEGFLIILNLFISFQLIVSFTLKDFLINLIVFIAVLSISFLLMKSVRKEIRRKEAMAQLAKSLEKANLRLKELDRQKTEFLSIASHQLRTPMSIIKGYIELIQDGAYGKISKETFKILSDMDITNERLVKLIDEFLDISRIEQGRTKFSFDMYDMNALISNVVQELSQKAIDKGLDLQWKPLRGKKDICMDEEKIRHVIFNFVDNAIKYTPKGSVKVFLEDEKNGLKVQVVDTGLGFNKIDEANFFQKFYRGQNVKTSNVGGTGLGIYVCKQFVEKHGGRVWAKSPGLGKGGEFGFWIPNDKSKAGKQGEVKNRGSLKSTTKKVKNNSLPTKVK